MGFHPRSFAAIVLASVLLATGLGLAQAQAQGGASLAPDEAWSYNPTGSPSLNDVAIDYTGSVGAIVTGDESSTNYDDLEVYAWDMASNPNSSSPVLSDDPSSSPFSSPEGMSVVAVEPRPNQKARYVAVANEGSSSSTEDNIYVYNVRRGPGTVNQVSYPDGTSAPGSAVQNMWFSLDGSQLVVEHISSSGNDGDVIDLFQQESGTQYTWVDRWSPEDQQQLRDVAVSADRSRAMAVTSDGLGVGDTTMRLFLFRLDSEITRISNPETRTQQGTTGHVDLDANGTFALFGSADNTVYYYQIVDEGPDADFPGSDVTKSFSEPWTRQGPSAVADLELSHRGDRFAVGYESGPLVVFDQTSIDSDGPLAARAIGPAFNVNTTPTGLTFTNQGERLFAVAGGLYGFHESQFDPDERLRPLWTVPGVQDFAVSQGGDKFVTIDSSQAKHLRQRYSADLAVDAPDTVRPGTNATIDLSVTNTGSTFDEFEFDAADLPSGWDASFDPTNLSLLPGETSNATIQLTPSSSAKPGDVTFNLTATSTADPGNKAIKTEVTVEVEQVFQAGIKLTQSPVEADRGGQATIAAVVANQGNDRAGFRVNLQQERSWSFTLEDQDRSSMTFQLDAGAQRTISATFQVPGEAGEGAANEITFTARPQDGGSSVSATGRIVVEPAYGGSLSVENSSVLVDPGQQARINLSVENTGNTPDTYEIRSSAQPSNPARFWRVAVEDTPVEVAPGSTETLQLVIDVPQEANATESATVSLTLSSQSTGNQLDATTVQFDIRDPPEDENGLPIPLILAPLALGAAALARRRTTG